MAVYIFKCPICLEYYITRSTKSRTCRNACRQKKYSINKKLNKKPKKEPNITTRQDVYRVGNHTSDTIGPTYSDLIEDNSQRDISDNVSSIDSSRV